MNKRAEELALKTYPISTSYLSESNGDGDRNHPRRLAFIEGYEQAEKDLALTWGDVELLDFYAMRCQVEESKGRKFNSSQEFFEEVLRRFNKAKEGKK